MFSPAGWFARRQSSREAWRAGARALIQLDEADAYYEAQRRAARARKAGDAASFSHWCKVAVEVARLTPKAKMDMAELKRILDDDQP